MTQISQTHTTSIICRRRRALLLSICHQFEGKGEEPDLKEELGGQAMKGVDCGLEKEGLVALSSIVEEEGCRRGKGERSRS
ncbi:hypothetical protein FNV43_RR00376 [Rhamnella rubrinervis]|uniref:Uncharacterized protein n=1 Tax=Rhamnella rubrinervis TaxID=2594499 RepID=A0A8K0MRV2_9ROSA|nr:hypothetical protein FNV43_RR00376 [Rhamnella rubrinervis]